MNSKLFRWPNYIRTFGFHRGSTIFAKVELGLGGEDAGNLALKVPGLAGPMRLRRNVSDLATFWQVMVKEEYSIASFPQKKRLLEKYSERVAAGQRPLIVDCGANVGCAAVWFASKFEHAQVIAVEPDADNFAMLVANARPYSNIKCVRGAVWTGRGQLVVTNREGGAAGLRVTEVAEIDGLQPVEAYSLEDILMMSSTNAPMIVKIDIEGAEAQLFEANTDWVARTDLIIVELHDWLIPWGGTSRPLMRCVSQIPFDYVFQGENFFFFRDFGSLD